MLCVGRQALNIVCDRLFSAPILLLILCVVFLCIVVVFVFVCCRLVFFGIGNVPDQTLQWRHGGQRLLHRDDAARQVKDVAQHDGRRGAVATAPVSHRQRGRAARLSQQQTPHILKDLLPCDRLFDQPGLPRRHQAEGRQVWRLLLADVSALRRLFVHGFCPCSRASRRSNVGQQSEPNL